MKIILMLAVCLSLIGCKGIPKYPDDLKSFHMILLPGYPLSEEMLSKVENRDDIQTRSEGVNMPSCLKFEIVQTNPYVFKYISEVYLGDCHEVAGYKPDENVKLWNWIDDVFKKAQENGCFR